MKPAQTLTAGHVSTKNISSAKKNFNLIIEYFYLTVFLCLLDQHAFHDLLFEPTSVIKMTSLSHKQLVNSTYVLNFSA